MNGSVTISKDRRTLTVRVPFAIRKRGGRKLVIAPEGASWPVPRPRVDNSMVKAIARAHRWKRMLENGEFSSVAELAAAENTESGAGKNGIRSGGHESKLLE